MADRARQDDDGLISFYCPGCESDLGHRIDPRSWSFDGNLERPTISPSVLVRWGNGRACHSFITEGRIEYLDDSTHSLAGRTIDLPGWPADGAPEVAS